MFLRTLLVSAAFVAGLPLAVASESSPAPPNPAIDADGHLRDMKAALELRRQRRVTEEDFLRMSREPGTIVLDARSPRRFGELHVKGAVNLNFADFTAESLAALVPDKATRILIYCNNNFFNAEPFPKKSLSASLNVPTFTTLYSYGYRNVYELGPYLDARNTKLEFAGTQIPPRVAN
jgi:hypothetical protein